MWLCIWLSSPFAGVTGSNLFMTAGQAANDPHPIFSVLSLFRYSAGCDTFFKIITDRWTVFFILMQASEVLRTRKLTQSLATLPSLVITAALYWSNVTRKVHLDSPIKAVGLAIFIVCYSFRCL